MPSGWGCVINCRSDRSGLITGSIRAAARMSRSARSIFPSGSLFETGCVRSSDTAHGTHGTHGNHGTYAGDEGPRLRGRLLAGAGFRAAWAARPRESRGEPLRTGRAGANENVQEQLEPF